MNIIDMNTNIADTLISLETAKLAAEKGFDIKVQDSYNLYFHNDKGPFYRLEPNLQYPKQNYNQFSDSQFSAPTQSLLQKWLRDERNLFVYVIPRFDGFDHAQYFCNYEIYYPGDVESRDIEGDGSYTYEEALEKGLQEALKQI